MRTAATAATFIGLVVSPVELRSVDRRLSSCSVYSNAECAAGNNIRIDAAKTRMVRSPVLQAGTGRNWASADRGVAAHTAASPLGTTATKRNDVETARI